MRFEYDHPVIKDNNAKGLMQHLTPSELADVANELEADNKELREVLRMVKDFHLRDLDEHIQKCITEVERS